MICARMDLISATDLHAENREEGGHEAMDEAGLQLVSLFRLSEVSARARELEQ